MDTPLSRRMALVAVAAAVLSCAGPPRDTPEVPAQEVCRWGRPSGRELVVVDLLLRAGQFNRVATAADSAAVAAAGGRVLHAFNVAALRVEVPAEGLLSLATGPDGIAHAAYPVRDRDRHHVRVQVFFDRPATSADVRRVDQAGGSVRAGLPPLPLLSEVETPFSITVADSLLARVEAVPGVASVRAEAVACVTLL